MISVVIPLKGKTPQFNTLIEQLQRQANVVTEVIVIRKGSIGYARNKGVTWAKGEIIAFIDADCLLPNGRWLENMLLPFSDPNVVMVHTCGTFHKDDPAIMRYSILSNLMDESTLPGTGHCLIRKDAIIEAGNFKDLKACEDLELISKLKGKIVYLPEHAVYHYHATTIRQLLSKQWRNSKYCSKIGVTGNNTNNKSRIKYNGTRFLRALIGREDRAWLLFPFVGSLQLLISKIAPLSN